MKDATPRSLGSLHNRTTCYEARLHNRTTGQVIVLGFNASQTRRALLDVIMNRAEDLRSFLPDGGEYNGDLERDAAGRWSLPFCGGWVAEFSGRTERQVRCALNMGLDR